MKKYIFLAFIALFTNRVATAQKTENPKTQQLADISFGFGNKQGSVVAGYFYNWNLGKSRKFFIGTGARFNTFYGTGVSFTSAPSSLAGDKLKEDTLLAAKPNIFSFNVLINLGYNITPKLQAGFSIDAIGASFGSEGTPTFISNGFPTSTKAKPTGFNVLLISDNDKGSLNSELFARYRWNDSWGVKLGLQFFFAEYTTNTEVQTTPGGDKNDMFRKKMAGVGIGVTYNLKK